MAKPQRLTLAFLGGAGTVTGSKYLLRAPGAAVMLDCGLFQGLKALRLRNWEAPPVAPKDLDAIVLTHAHLDHSGYLPRFAKLGFRGPVLCSAGTRDLCGVLLPDSGHLQEEEARFANARGFSKHHPALPLYTADEARECLKAFSVLPFAREHVVKDGVAVTLRPAGHILGASSAMLRAGGTRVVFSGDLGRMHDPVMPPPQRVAETDYLVVESTYGNRRHRAVDAEVELGGHLDRALKRGGVVVIPAFAVGRAQAILHYLARLKARRAIPDVPVFLNSPMAIEATRLYFKHMDGHRLSEEQVEAARAVATMVEGADESRELNARSGPMVIVSASGMATGGRVLHHLKAFAPDAKNMILLPGFQAAATRGAALAAGATEVKIHGEYVPVRAEVVQMDSMSAHADCAEILDWLKGFRQPPRHTFVTHGEPAAADELRRRIEDTFGWPASVPGMGETVALD